MNGVYRMLFSALGTKKGRIEMYFLIPKNLHNG